MDKYYKGILIRDEETLDRLNFCIETYELALNNEEYTDEERLDVLYNIGDWCNKQHSYFAMKFHYTPSPNNVKFSNSMSAFYKLINEIKDKISEIEKKIKDIEIAERNEKLSKMSWFEKMKFKKNKNKFKKE